MSQKDTGFSRRLAYIRWLRARGRPAPETDKELAESTGVGVPWLQKWKSRPDAPDTRSIAHTFVRGLGLTPAQGIWLLDGTGEPPEPPMWKGWKVSPRFAQLDTLTDPPEPRAPKTSRRVSSGKRKGLP